MGAFKEPHSGVLIDLFLVESAATEDGCKARALAPELVAHQILVKLEGLGFIRK